MNHPHLLINSDRIFQDFMYDQQLQMQIGSDIYLIHIRGKCVVTRILTSGYLRPLLSALVIQKSR